MSGATAESVDWTQLVFRGAVPTQCPHRIHSVGSHGRGFMAKWCHKLARHGQICWACVSGHSFIKGSLDEKLPSYEVFKIRENRCLENRCQENRCLENRWQENRCLENRCWENRCQENRCLKKRCLENRCWKLDKKLIKRWQKVDQKLIELT